MVVVFYWVLVDVLVEVVGQFMYGFGFVCCNCELVQWWCGICCIGVVVWIEYQVVVGIIVVGNVLEMCFVIDDGSFVVQCVYVVGLGLGD